MNINIRKAVASGLASGALILSSFATPAFAATTLQISGNGSGSDNDANLNVTNSSSLVQDNYAYIKNNVKVDADTGNNDANDNTGGDVEIDTGDAIADVSIANFANKNSASFDCCPLGGSGSIKIDGNGSDSDNTANVNLSNTHVAFQTNDAYVDNDVDVDADTGWNDANDNTGGDVSIDTGNSRADVDLWTAVNKNHLSIGGGAGGSGSGSGWSAWITGNGSGSDNDVNLNITSFNSLVQDNYADIYNDVYVYVDTGNNDANDNTGGDVSIDTGNAVATVDVTNLANLNWARLSCGCPLSDLVAKISGNGSDSDNTINANLKDTNSLFQVNDAYLDNWLDVDADTGNNDANDNTGEGTDPSIDTGNAVSDVDVVNSANLNAAGSGFLPSLDFDFDLSEVLFLLLGAS